jgi:hypothetical protein
VPEPEAFYKATYVQGLWAERGRTGGGLGETQRRLPARLERVAVLGSGEAMNENIKNLLRLIEEKPELPVIAMVDGEIAGYDSGYWLGRIGATTVDEYIDPPEESMIFKSDDDVFDALERCLSEEAYEALPEDEEDCREIYNALPWKKAIIVYVELP